MDVFFPYIDGNNFLIFFLIKGKGVNVILLIRLKVYFMGIFINTNPKKTYDFIVVTCCHES